MKDKVIIKQFKNKAKKSVAGLTPEHAIYDKNGVRLDAKLGNVNLQEFRDLQQQGVDAIKNQEAQSIQAVANREVKILTKSDASFISSTTDGLEGNNVQANLNELVSAINNNDDQIDSLREEINQLVCTTKESFNNVIKALYIDFGTNGYSYEDVRIGFVSRNLSDNYISIRGVWNNGGGYTVFEGALYGTSTLSFT